MPLHGLTMGDIFGKDSSLTSVMPGCPDGTIFAESHLIGWINMISTCLTIPGIMIQIYLVLCYTKFTPAYSALLGFVPMLEYWGIIYCTFY